MINKDDMAKMRTQGFTGSKRTTYLLVILLLLSLGACGPKPIPPGSGEVPKGIQPGIASPLLQYSAVVDPHEKNKVALLDIGEEALLLRIHLIRAARHSIDMQTIIWVNDETGRLLMYEMIQAAKRGVKVRLLIDHFVSERHPEIAAFLATVHPNLQIKLYNPVVGLFSGHRIYPSILDQLIHLLTGFDRVNQRMHNKVFVVDNQVGITGGRNNQNAYYDQARGMNYRDRDILIDGPVAADMRKSFDKFWDFKDSVPIQSLVDWQDKVENGTLKTWLTKKDFVFNGLFAKLLTDANNQQRIRETFVHQLHPVDKAYFIADDPGKNKKRFLWRFFGSGKITRELAKLVSNAKESISINTPYLVLTDPAIYLFRKLVRKHPDIDIRIATNSLAATDSWYCYAISFQQKQVMLTDLKFKIYEFKPLPGDMRSYMPSFDTLRSRELTPTEKEEFEAAGLMPVRSGQGLQRAPLPAEPYFSMHAKSLVIDDQITFIGSYNLDARSENLNTEAGLVVQDKRFAALAKKSIMQDMLPQNSWVIAKNKYPLGLGVPNAILEELSRLIPFIDPWPLRYAGSYNLKKNKTPLEVGHKDFYEHYKWVGSFPNVPAERGGKILGAVTTKTFLGIIKPLL
ncbi:MAG: phospholipase D family protein [Candidatus Electrothrix sp. ATG2]|nr:phospholipase D family protein [Candidatus Electrothrix sp. ATG2]